MVLLPVIHAMGGSERCLLLLATKIGLSAAPLLPLACEKLRNAGYSLATLVTGSPARA